MLWSGRTEEAQAAFRAAIEWSPNNGWAAAGLLRAAEARGDAAGAAQARTLLAKNWFGGEAPPLDRL